MTPTRFDVIEAQILSHFIPVLIYNDWSGIDESDSVQLKNWMAQMESRIPESHIAFHWDVTATEYFARCNVVGVCGYCSDVRLVYLFRE